MLNETRIRENWEKLKFRIGQLTDRPVEIIAVTKTHPETIYDLCVNLGIKKIGENRIQELLAKNAARPGAKKLLHIHLIGPLQTNKVKFLPENVDSLDTLSSLETVNKINDRWNQPQPLSALLQINSTDETGKAGIHYQDRAGIIALARACLDSSKLHLEGLMTMGPTPKASYDIPDKKYTDDTRKAFLKIRNLLDELQNELGVALPRLSMGMTHDYDIAIECGSTEIRIGSLLFGERDYNI